MSTANTRSTQSSLYWVSSRKFRKKERKNQQDDSSGGTKFPLLCLKKEFSKGSFCLELGGLVGLLFGDCRISRCFILASVVDLFLASKVVMSESWVIDRFLLRISDERLAGTGESPLSDRAIGETSARPRPLVPLLEYLRDNLPPARVAVLEGGDMD